MAKVRAVTKGYFGGVIRENGDVFEWPEDTKLASWVKPVSGHVEAESDDGKADDGKKADAPAKGKGRGKGKTVDAPTAAPFEDAPDPEAAKGNGVVEALGGPAPDWIAPGTPHTPVMADE